MRWVGGPKMSAFVQVQGKIVHLKVDRVKNYQIFVDVVVELPLIQYPQCNVPSR